MQYFTNLNLRNVSKLIQNVRIKKYIEMHLILRLDN